MGGLWLWNIRLPSGLVMVVVPSGFRVIVHQICPAPKPTACRFGRNR